MSNIKRIRLRMTYWKIDIVRNQPKRENPLHIILLVIATWNLLVIAYCKQELTFIIIIIQKRAFVAAYLSRQQLIRILCILFKIKIIRIHSSNKAITSWTHIISHLLYFSLLFEYSVSVRIFILTKFHSLIACFYCITHVRIHALMRILFSLFRQGFRKVHISYTFSVIIITNVRDYFFCTIYNLIVILLTHQTVHTVKHSLSLNVSDWLCHVCKNISQSLSISNEFIWLRCILEEQTQT